MMRKIANILLVVLIVFSTKAVVQAQNGDNVFMIVDEPAKPEGGYEAFYLYVQKRLKYPTEARKHGVEGKVYVQFVVDTDGGLTEVKVVKGIGAGCDEVALDAISSAPNWHPARHEGTNVKQRIILPITFSLGSDMAPETEPKKDTLSGYYLGLHTGEIIKAKQLDYKTPAFGKKHFRLDGDKERYDFSQVKFYRNHTGYHLKGDPVGSGPAFYKREFHGTRINTYSIERTTYTAGAPGMYGAPMGGTFNTYTLDYYTKDDGEMKKMKLANLKLDLKDNSASMVYLEKVSGINKVNGILYGAGAAMIIGGIIATANSAKKDESLPPGDSSISISPFVFIGAVVVNIPWFTKGTKRKKMQEALMLYDK